MRLVRGQRVDVLVDPPLTADKMVTHWRLSWTERLARNARSPAAVCVNIMVFGLPSAFAAFLGLPIV